MGVMSTPTLPRVAVCGLSLEASTFNPGATRIADFRPKRGREVLQERPFLADGGSLAEAARWVPILTGRAIPGAPVPAEDYATLKTEILAGLRASLAEDGPLDGVVLDLHGAMNVIGMDDAEGDLAVAVRALVGPETLISTGMDLHGNVSRRLAHALDLLTCYRMAPHEDALETKERAVRNLLDRLTLDPARRRPLKAWVPVPILLPGEKTSTRLEPATSLYARVPQIEALDGVLDAGIWIGYAWGDEPRNCCVVMVTGDDETVITREASRLAQAVWRARDDFAFVAPTGTLAEVLDAALSSDVHPYLISDSGDNPTAGGTGDVSWTLGELIADPRITAGGKSVIFASVHDRQAVDACVAAGVGAEVDVEVGGVIDPGPRGPVPVHGVVAHIATGDPEADVEVVLAVGDLSVLITRNRKPYHRMVDFERNGLDAPGADIVIVKIGYLEPELYAIAADWMLALTPGSVDQDLLRLGHHRISRPMFPFDTGFTDPDLHVRIVPMADQPDE